MAWDWQIYSDDQDYTLAEAWDGGDEPVCVLRIPVGCAIDLKSEAVQSVLESIYDTGRLNGESMGRFQLQHEIRTAWARLIGGDWR